MSRNQPNALAPPPHPENDTKNYYNPSTKINHHAHADAVIIPASEQREKLDPRIVVSKGNASLVRECAASNKRILEADHRVIIVGGGPAGLSAAVYAARANMMPLVVARDGGQLESTSQVDNYPGFEVGWWPPDAATRLTPHAARRTPPPPHSPCPAD